MAPSGPALPARKGPAGKRLAPISDNTRNLPIASAQEIELEDGTKIPVKIPPGMPPHQAAALLEYLKQNPDAAKQVHAQAQQMLKTPGLANGFLNMQSNMSNPESIKVFEALKDDPDLKVVFDDVMANGPAAFSKYWDDTDLMAKVSAKLKGLNLGPGQQPAAAGSATAAPAGPPANLHEAAKRGDVEAAAQFLADGKNVDEPNERGVTPLGIAVGFNRVAVVSLLLEKGAAVDKRDPAGNTVLHYAAGYGRKEVAELLLAAGADPSATNKAGQKPADAARMNKEKHMVELLESKAAATSGKPSSAAEQ